MPTLDERYLEFRDRTAAVFAAFPQMEALRYTVFKQLWVQRRGALPTAWLAHWARRLLRRVRRAGPLTRADVLLVLEGRRDLGPAMMLPVWEACRRKGLRTQLIALHVPFPLPPETCRVAGAYCGPAPDWDEVAWRALLEVLPELDQPTLRRAFVLAAPAAGALWKLAGEILDVVQPRVVVIKSNVMAGAVALASRARTERRKTIQLQHGVPQAFYTPVLEDAMLTWGESSNAILRGLGVSENRLVTAGSPRHDTMQPLPAARARLCAALGLADRPTLVFFSNGNDLDRNGAAPAGCAAWLEAAAATFPEMNLVARLHPNEDGSLYRDARHLRITRQEVDLITTLSGADIVASLCSTVLYEALLFGKPVWQFHAPDWPPLEDNWKQGLAERVSSLEDLQTKLRHWLQNPEPAARWLEAADRVFANRGRAAEAVADYLAELVAGGTLAFGAKPSDSREPVAKL